MYHLTLTLTERLTLDHVGHRYSHGYDLYRLLWVESEQSPEVDWDHDGPITFNIPEHTAWDIWQVGHDSNFRWDLFAPELSEKLTEFCQQIV
jgi:hypothetical protein